jgi:ABC-type transporter Mla maintaining outer membrane lipid asymmetry ATPase subunit MlaF
VRALIVRPRLLFIDDLYAHISSDRALCLKKLLRHKMDEAGLAIVVTTSYIKQIIDDSTDIVFLSPETVVVFKSGEELLGSNDESVKEYLSSNDIH